jgi:UDP-N-acetyl-D-galactosamine dehydrogenase
MYQYGIDILNEQPNISQYSAIILAVAHTNFSGLNLQTSENCVVFDVKGVLPMQNVDGRL